MAKNKEQLDNIQQKGVQFFDKTGKHWHNKAGSNKLALCDSIDDIIEGKSELYQFEHKFTSVRTLSKNDKEREIQAYVLFALTDGNFLLLKQHRELK